VSVVEVSNSSGERQRIPFELAVLAALFLLTGISGLVGFVQEFLNHNINVDPSLLGIPIGIGLLRFRRGWRWLALFCIALDFVVMVAFVVFGGPPQVLVLGRPIPLPAQAVVALEAATLLVLAWAFLALARRKVAVLFRPQSR
jgi:hypothetical protein